MKLLLRILPIVVLLAAAAGEARADAIVLKNGNKLEGILLWQRNGKTQIKTSGGVHTLDDSIIARIDKDAPSRESMIEVEMALRRHDVCGALRLLAQSLDESGEKSDSIEEFIKNAKNLPAELAELKTDKRQEAATALRKVEPSITSVPDGKALIAKCWQSLGEEMRASQAYSELPAAFLKDRPDLQENAISFLTSRIRSSMTSDEFDKVLEMIDGLARVSPDRAKQWEVSAYFQWGARKRDKGDFEGALKIYAGRMMEKSPLIAKDRIEYTLQQLREGIKSEKDYKEAIRLHEAYGMQGAPASTLPALGDLYFKYGRFLFDKGRYADARAAFEKYYDVLEAKDRLWSQRSDYKQRLDALKPDDANGRYELGKFCHDNGLLIEAEEMFKEAGKDETLKVNAEIQLKIVHEERELQLAESAKRSYEAGQYIQTVSACMDFQKDFADSDLLPDMNKLLEDTRARMEEAKGQRPSEAEALYQQAERDLLKQQYLQSLQTIDTVLKDYSDTPSAKRAVELKRAVINAAQTAYLEGKIEPQSKLRDYLRKAGAGDDGLSSEIKNLFSEFEKEK
jgi:hypothetical protein